MAILSARFRVLLIFLMAVMAGMVVRAQDRRPPPRPAPGQAVRPGRPGGSGGGHSPVVKPAPSRPPGGGPGSVKPPVGRPGSVKPPGGGGPGGGRPPGGGPGGRPPGNRPSVGHRPPGWGPHRPVYSRPPHYWGGRRYYTYHRYYYHPYQPYRWGPAWHPVGFFLSAVAASAVIIAYNDINYRYEAGVYYQPVDGGFRVVPPPIGAMVPVLPRDAASLWVGDDHFFYYGGVFYVQGGGGYQVVRAPAGAIVYNLPDGCTTVNADGVTYLQYNGDLYQPITDNEGQPAYEVVEIEDGN